MDRNHIIVIGSLNYDIVFMQKRLPRRGETLTAESVAFCGGGKGANQAVQCAKLGIDTYLVGKVGNDTFGAFLVQEIERQGVDVSYVEPGIKNTGIASVNALLDGNVYSTISRGANYDITRDDIDRARPAMEASKILLLQLEIPMDVISYALDLAEACGLYVILNAAPAVPIDSRVLAKVDCLVVNEEEAGFYTGRKIYDLISAKENCNDLLDKVKECVVITLGAQGSVLCSRNGIREFPAVVNGPVVETTGAGDSYIGGFAYQRFLDKTPEEACLFASQVAGYTISGMGAQSAMPTIGQLGQGLKPAGL